MDHVGGSSGQEVGAVTMTSAEACGAAEPTGLLLPAPCHPCSICIGLLQNLGHQAPAQGPGMVALSSSDSALPGPASAAPIIDPEALCRVLRDSPAAVTSFTLDVNIPLSVHLRERTLYEYLTARYRHVFSRDGYSYWMMIRVWLCTV